MNIGETIRARRVILRMTQQQVAEQVGVAPLTVGRWESGATSPTVDDLHKLAEALGCTATDLITDAPISPTPSSQAAKP